MSCYEWERGTIKLPSAEYIKVRKVCQDARNALSQKIYDHAQAFWKAIPAAAKRDPQFYRACAHAFCYGTPKEGDYGYNKKVPQFQGIAQYYKDPYTGWDKTRGDEQLAQAVYDVLVYGKRYDGPPTRIQKTDLPFATNKTTVYDCGEPSFRFDPEKKTVTWEVPENNHAREHAREHPLAKALFDALYKVKWTRGSGGEIVGNDEYNQDADYAGGGANYVIESFGPTTKARSRGQIYRGW